jgi:hypothetical protein
MKPWLTPETVALAVAKRVARVGDFDENIAGPFRRRGIAIGGSGAFTVALGEQVFEVAVRDVTLGGPR